MGNKFRRGAAVVERGRLVSRHGMATRFTKDRFIERKEGTRATLSQMDKMTYYGRYATSPSGVLS